MPIDTSHRIVNSRTGAVTFDIDDRGILNDQSDIALFYPPITWPLLVGSLSSFIFSNFTNNSVFRVFAVRANTTVAGGASAAVQLVHCAQGVALGSGTNQLTAGLDLTTTAPAKLAGTLIATPTDILPGDCLGVVFSGTLTGLVGCLTVALRRRS